MTPKEEAQKMIKEGSDLNDPFNFALHLGDEIIRDIKRGISNDRRMEYWQQVMLEIENIRDAKS